MEQIEKQIGKEASVESTLQIEKKLNEIIPVLAHGLIKRLAKKGLAGKVKISSIAGSDWGVTKSSDNPSDVPNVIVYPRDYLSKDIGLVNARLRHEVGNLNYPISKEINQLEEWCIEKNIPPELLISLTEAVQEASVNYLEIKNSFSDRPEENFRALYEHEINTAQVAENIAQNPKYKQAVDLSLLYSLGQTGIIPNEQYKQAYDNCAQPVKDVFDKRTTALLDQIIKTSNSDKKIKLIRDHLWPTFFKLIEQSKPDEDKPEQNQKSQEDQRKSEGKLQNSKESDDEDNGQKNPDGNGDGESNNEETRFDKQELNETQDIRGQKEGAGIKESDDQNLAEKFFNEQLKKIQERVNKINKEISDRETVDQGDLKQREMFSASEIKKFIEQKIRELKNKGDDESKEKIEELQKLEEQLEGLNEKRREKKSPDSEKEFTPGGPSREQSLLDLFDRSNPGLLDQLKKTEDLVGSKFITRDEKGEIVEKKSDIEVGEIIQQRESEEKEEVILKQLDTLDEIKRQQQARLESVYRELSGLDGRALRIYVEYRESMKDFIRDLVDFFTEKFKLDKEFLYEKHQRRGARLEKGFTRNILGEREGKIVVGLASLERKRPPQKPQINWSLIIDNSGSCSGETIEQEKRLAVALIEVTKILDIPLEIITFSEKKDKNGNHSDHYIFLKNFEQEMYGEDLQKIVLLKADQGTPDVITLEGACSSIETFMDKFKRSYNFVYFMTDGQSSVGSIRKVIEKHKNNMVITGIGLEEAASSIASTWGKNALAVPDTKKLPYLFMQKMEQQIDQTFD